jgi:hypothetical protein
MPKYNVGDQVWYCDKGLKEIHVTCPDCLGSGRLEVIMGDGTHVGIDCANCQHGAESTGWVLDYEWAAQCRFGTISGMEIRGKKIEYHIGTICQYYSRLENEVFATQEEVSVYAEITKAEYEIEQQHKIESKEQHAHSWAWNATYHRRQLADHRKQIEYHTRKLEVARKKAKEPTEESSPA